MRRFQIRNTFGAINNRKLINTGYNLILNNKSNATYVFASKIYFHWNCYFDSAALFHLLFPHKHSRSFVLCTKGKKQYSKIQFDVI